MAFYDNSLWPVASGRTPSWEQQSQPPSRSGTSSVGPREELDSFVSQFAEVERAIDNLVKSGKMPFGASGVRRESLPTARQYSEFENQRVGGMQRHHSVSEFDGMRPASGSNLQSFYATQRFGPRPTEQDQAMQAKRRMAAQRERELRNYHQEQQYHKHVAGPKSDRSMSPNAGMTEEERRELIARQHRALYGNDSTLYTEQTSRPGSQDARNAPPIRNGSSPLAYDAFGIPGQNTSGEPAVQMPPRDNQGKDGSSAQQRSRANSNSSPSSNPTTNFSLFDNAQQSSRTSTSSPGGSPPHQGTKSSSGPAPIGTRPTSGQVVGQGLQKRSTTPLPSPLSFGFSANDQSNNERSTSASSNPSSSVADKGVGLGWGNNSGVWGNSKNLGVQASVWG